MATVKTAISINEPLYEMVNKLTAELNISRSRLFVVAVEEFIRRHENQRLLQQINLIYDDLPEAEDAQLHSARRRQHRKLVEAQW
ncbi:MAG: CopG family transcriptional regulator [Anaerolineaceae bacterium 4572_5.2]|nr:MAG: CopG family transcriptional regulator [Anaerolineaceae bacterium 4572_5.2]